MVNSHNPGRPTLIRLSWGRPVREKKALASAPASRPSPSQSASANQASTVAPGMPFSARSLLSAAPAAAGQAPSQPAAAEAARGPAGGSPGGCLPLSPARRCAGRGGSVLDDRRPAGDPAPGGGGLAPALPVLAAGGSHACAPSGRPFQQNCGAVPSAEQLHVGKAPQRRLAEGPNFQIAVPAVGLAAPQLDLAGAQQALRALGPARLLPFRSTRSGRLLASQCTSMCHQLLTWKAANASLPAASAFMLACAWVVRRACC